jgi:hypothetical protein
MDKQNRENHLHFFIEQEESFLSWIANEATCLLSLDEYRLGDKPTPQFIRQVHTVSKERLDEAKRRLGYVEDAFVGSTEFTKDNAKRLPARLAQVFTDVERIYYSINPAHQSIKLKYFGETDVYRTAPYVDMDEIHIHAARSEAESRCQTLIENGLTSAYVRFVPSQNCDAITVDCGELHRWSGCDSIQRRLLTGNKYVARVLLSGQKKPVRTNLGFILLCQDKAPMVEQSLPRQQRSDSAELDKRKIALPIYTDYSFYAND